MPVRDFARVSIETSAGNVMLELTPVRQRIAARIRAVLAREKAAYSYGHRLARAVAVELTRRDVFIPSYAAPRYRRALLGGFEMDGSYGNSNYPAALTVDQAAALFAHSVHASRLPPDSVLPSAYVMRELAHPFSDLPDSAVGSVLASCAVLRRGAFPLAMFWDRRRHTVSIIYAEASANTWTRSAPQRIGVPVGERVEHAIDQCRYLTFNATVHDIDHLAHASFDAVRLGAVNPPCPLPVVLASVNGGPEAAPPLSSADLLHGLFRFAEGNGISLMEFVQRRAREHPRELAESVAAAVEHVRAIDHSVDYAGSLHGIATVLAFDSALALCFDGNACQIFRRASHADAWTAVSGSTPAPSTAFVPLHKLLADHAYEVRGPLDAALVQVDHSSVMDRLLARINRALSPSGILLSCVPASTRPHGHLAIREEPAAVIAVRDAVRALVPDVTRSAIERATDLLARFEASPAVVLGAASLSPSEREVLAEIPVQAWPFLLAAAMVSDVRARGEHGVVARVVAALLVRGADNRPGASLFRWSLLSALHRMTRRDSALSRRLMPITVDGTDAARVRDGVSVQFCFGAHGSEAVEAVPEHLLWMLATSCRVNIKNSRGVTVAAAMPAPTSYDDEPVVGHRNVMPSRTVAFRGESGRLYPVRLRLTASAIGELRLLRRPCCSCGVSFSADVLPAVSAASRSDTQGYVVERIEEAPPSSTRGSQPFRPFRPLRPQTAVPEYVSLFCPSCRSIPPHTASNATASVLVHEVGAPRGLTSIRVPVYYSSPAQSADVLEREPDESAPPDGQIQSYGYAPALVPFRSRNEARRPDAFLLGIELEVEPSSRRPIVMDRADAFTRVMGVIHRHRVPQYLYVKRDSSVPDGFEIVSQPMSESWWLTTGKAVWADVLAALREGGWVSHASGRCGMHIHTSRAAWTPMQVDRMIRLLHAYPDVFRKLAQRSSETYASFTSALARPSVARQTALHHAVAHLKHHRGAAVPSPALPRSTAVNVVSHRPTLEFRLFRGTLLHSSFCKNVELVMAVHALCASHDLCAGGRTASDAVKALYEFRSQYRMLAAFIEQRFPNVVAERRGTRDVVFENGEGGTDALEPTAAPRPSATLPTAETRTGSLTL